MNINSEISIVDIDTVSGLIGYYDKISVLFFESFGKQLDKKLWEWAYINNPFGNPLVSLAIHDGKVVGHYAVVPMNLENKTESIRGFLSMTTMVAVDFRKHKLFQLLAERVFSKINALNEPALVFGFPNDNSAPGFKKRLGWEISEEYKVVTLQANMLSDAVQLLEEYVGSNSLTLNLEKDEVCKWRANKPNQVWSYDNGIGLKSIGEGFDVMHLSSPADLMNVKFESTCNMVLPVSDEFISNSDCEISFSYRFGYRIFNMQSQPKIFVQMSMSDIF